MATDMNGGQALVAALEAHGVRTVFGIPGTHNLPIYGALAESQITHVLTRHEQGAGYAADGYARTSGKPGVAITTSGPAILNTAAAAAQAYSDSIPVLLISPGLPLRHPSNGNGILHEIKNQTGAMDSVVGHSQRVTSVAEIPLAVAQCFAAMTSGRPRPAYLEIPLDILDEAAPVTILGPIAQSAVTAPVAALETARALLAAADSPLIIAGGGSSGAATPLRELAELLGAPVLTTTNGKGVLPESHDLSLGAGVHLPSVKELVTESDAILAVGTELAPSDFWYGPLEAEGKLIRIDIDPTSVCTNAIPEVALIGDASATLRALTDGLVREPATQRAAQWRIRLRSDSEVEGKNYLGILAALDKALDEDAILVGDSTMACYYGAMANLPLHRPRSFLYPTGVGTLGYGLPAAIGAKIAAGDRQVVAMLGDGGVMFTIAELAAAAELAVPLPIIVVDNGGYGEIRDEMIERSDPVHAVGLAAIDFPALARSMGCLGVGLESSADLTDAVTKAFAADRPTVIHIREEKS
ncbi:5-guanidino-2-oxopentanoate decarboxylase [Rhodococcus sp. PAMC28707]|uniref:thiamine pyrophosphate-binding protein n=1 Tax=unclassified Rhodococcus (in: high G+C Gram-positive bacteria) TaxID=192944 RepID=UPI00109E1F78|nr:MULTISPECIES: 5-guanidino-2-oxopentanoate decarboxylase [unclassified Rhodococcus (in: high G+C Gram-positive bacteria)]QCB51930.1 5-guanidino-2-oxopentanoate decarboxylase [Rhodococcus sp. PAMC28705]QCB59900.1 5-guanidino-2-oxopentanoate decarboxylase [Rhodococcus sp. PAMC28707]